MRRCGAPCQPVSSRRPSRAQRATCSSTSSSMVRALRGRRGVGAAFAGEVARLRGAAAVGAARLRGGVLVEEAIAIVLGVGEVDARAVGRGETEPAAEGDHERGLIAHNL